MEANYDTFTVSDLRALAREHGLRGYSRLRTAELIGFLQDILRPMPAARSPSNLYLLQDPPSKPIPAARPPSKPIPAPRPPFKTYTYIYIYINIYNIYASRPLFKPIPAPRPPSNLYLLQDPPLKPIPAARPPSKPILAPRPPFETFSCFKTSF